MCGSDCIKKAENPHLDNASHRTQGPLKLGIPLEMLLALERRKSGYEDMPKGASNFRTGRKRGEGKKLKV